MQSIYTRGLISFHHVALPSSKALSLLGLSWDSIISFLLLSSGNEAWRRPAQYLKAQAWMFIIWLRIEIVNNTVLVGEWWEKSWKSESLLELLPYWEEGRDGWAWWAAVYGIAQSWTWLKWLSSSSRECEKLEKHYVWILGLGQSL